MGRAAAHGRAPLWVFKTAFGAWMWRCRRCDYGSFQLTQQGAQHDALRHCRKMAEATP